MLFVTCLFLFSCEKDDEDISPVKKEKIEESKDTVITPVDTSSNPTDTVIVPVDTTITPVDTTITPVDTVVVVPPRANSFAEGLTVGQLLVGDKIKFTINQGTYEAIVLGVNESHNSIAIGNIYCIGVCSMGYNGGNTNISGNNKTIELWTL